MIKQSNRWIALGTLGAMSLTAFGGAMTTEAQASVKGKRNMTIGFGAVTAYGLLKHKRTATVVGGVGTAASYLMYRKAKKKQSSREASRRRYYQRRYGRNWRNHYVPAG